MKVHTHLRSRLLVHVAPGREHSWLCIWSRVVLLSKSPRWCYVSSVSVSFLFFIFSFFCSCWHLPVAPRPKLASLALVESYCCLTWWVMSEMISTGDNPHLWAFQNDLGYECVVWLVYVCGTWLSFLVAWLYHQKHCVHGSRLIFTVICLGREDGEVGDVRVKVESIPFLHPFLSLIQLFVR